MLRLNEIDMAERYADVRLKLSHRNVLHIENWEKNANFVAKEN